MYFFLFSLCFSFFSYAEQSDKQNTVHLPTQNYLNKDPVPLEYTCYKLLKEKPIKNVNYFAFGWVHAVNKDKTRKIINQISKTRCEGGFTICQCLPERIIPTLKKIGIDTLFTPHVIKNKTYDINVIAMPHFPMNGINWDTLPKKNIFYSFIGYASYQLRKTIFQIKHPPNTVIKKRHAFHYFVNKRKRRAQEYSNILQRSRFSLCPRGFSPPTMRFWESLGCGAIPVSIADDLVLPSGFNWEECVVFVAEKDIFKIPAILAQITPEQEEQMRQKCFEAYEQFSGKNLISVIRQHYENK